MMDLQDLSVRPYRDKAGSMSPVQKEQVTEVLSGMVSILLLGTTMAIEEEDDISLCKA